MNADTQPAAGDALRPCPFCGARRARAAIWKDGVDGGKRMSVTCQGCGAGSAVFYGEAHAELLAAWNRRTPQEAASGAVQVQKVALDAARKALSMARPYVEAETTRTHDGTGGWTRRYDAGRCLIAVDEAIAAMKEQPQ